MLAYSGWGNMFLKKKKKKSWGNMVPIVLTLKSSTYYTPISLTKFWSPVQAMVKIITFTVTQKKNDKSKIKQFYLYGTCKLAIPICLGF